MVSFTATLLKFGQMGEKTGWTYIIIPANKAELLNPGNKKSFRIKGKLDSFQLKKVALLPMGEGKFIMPVNAVMRKAIRKQKGATVKVQMEIDKEELQPSPEFIECLKDEPLAFEHFNSLPKSHRNYFCKWIDSAKTDATKAKRIAKAINGLAKKYNFAEMLRN